MFLYDVICSVRMETFPLYRRNTETFRVKGSRDQENRILGDHSVIIPIAETTANRNPNYERVICQNSSSDQRHEAVAYPTEAIARDETQLC